MTCGYFYIGVVWWLWYMEGVA